MTQPSKPQRFVFLDVEATGLDHDRHQMTEIAWIVRHEDGFEQEHHIFPYHTIDGADPEALEITRYEERIAPRRKTPMAEWLPVFLRESRDAVIVGAVPDFDVRHLERACAKLGLEPTWDHHLLDVETLALPLMTTRPERPRSLAKTCEALGIPHDRDQAHGALYDARQAKAVFDRVWELLAAVRDAGAPVPTAAAQLEAAVASQQPVAEPTPQPTLDLRPQAPAADAPRAPAPPQVDPAAPRGPDVQPTSAPVAPSTPPVQPASARPPTTTDVSQGPIRPFEEPSPLPPVHPAAQIAGTKTPNHDESASPPRDPQSADQVKVLPQENVEESLFGALRRRVGRLTGESDDDPAPAGE